MTTTEDLIKALEALVVKGTFFNQKIKLSAGVRKLIKLNQITSFVMNEGRGDIFAKYNGKEFQLREAQVNITVNEPFDQLEIWSDISETIDVRFGTGGMIVAPGQKEYVTVNGQLVTALDSADIAAMGTNIADTLTAKEAGVTTEETSDVTVNAGATITIIAAATGTPKQTIVQRTDTVDSNLVRVGVDPGAAKGTILTKSYGSAVFSGGEALKVYNGTASPITVGISREFYN